MPLATGHRCRRNRHGLAYGDLSLPSTVQDFPDDGEAEAETESILELLVSTFEPVE